MPVIDLPYVGATQAEPSDCTRR